MKPPAPGPGERALGDPGRERRGDAGVDRVAALGEDAGARLRGELMPGGDGALHARSLACAQRRMQSRRNARRSRDGSSGSRRARGRERRGRAGAGLPRPVATTVTQTWPVSRSSIVAPKMMFVSSVARCADDLRGLVDLEEREVVAARDREQDALRADDLGLDQRRAERPLDGLARAVVARSSSRCP